MFTADRQKEGYCDSRLPMWKLVQWHEYMTQEDINSQLRTHSILSPFVTCPFYEKFLAESYVAVFLKVLSMQPLSHRGTDWLHPPNPKSTSIFFFPQRKDLLWNYCQQKTFSSYKRYGFILYTLLCFHPSPYWGLFNEEKNLIHWIAVAIVLHKNSFVLKMNHLWWFSASPLYLLWTAHGFYALSSRQKYRICKNLLKICMAISSDLYLTGRKTLSIKELQGILLNTVMKVNILKCTYVWNEMLCYKYTLFTNGAKMNAKNTAWEMFQYQFLWGSKHSPSSQPSSLW